MGVLQPCTTPVRKLVRKYIGGFVYGSTKIWKLRKQKKKITKHGLLQIEFTDDIIKSEMPLQSPVAYYTEEVNTNLAKTLLDFNGSLTKLGLTLLVK